MSLLLKNTRKSQSLVRALQCFYTRGYSSKHPIDFPDMGPSIPEYKDKEGESDTVLRNRLTYQSRKRGMSENGLLLANFASKHLTNFNRTELNQFDRLINKPSNDWDLFYWIMNKVDTPKDYDTPVMDMLKKFSQNEVMEARYHQPALKFDDKV